MSDILIIHFQCHIPLAVYTGAHTLVELIYLWVPLSERESDQITQVPDTIIVVITNCDVTWNWDIVHTLGGFRAYLELRPQDFPSSRIGPASLSANNNSTIKYPTRVQDPPKIQTLSPINFSTLNVNYLMLISHGLQGLVNNNAYNKSRGGTHAMWDSRGGPHGFKRWPLPHLHVTWHFVPCGT